MTARPHAVKQRRACAQSSCLRTAFGSRNCQYDADDAVRQVTPEVQLRFRLLGGLQHGSHPPSQRFDLAKGRHRFFVQLIGAEQEQLGFGEDSGEGIGKVVTQPPDAIVRRHSSTER